MTINDLKGKISTAALKQYRCAPDACTPEQLHNVLSGVVVE